ncbi:hypothetical protein [Nocardia sp. CA-135398]|uniref:hypothetical protein n=1 Tax=Nocardia sp. CA-135398 TaxID=3239977 RepID=UPI003D980689
MKDKSRDLHDRIQTVVEDLHTDSPEHPAIALLTKAADEIEVAAMANSSRRHADYEQKSTR